MREERFNECLDLFRRGKKDGIEEIYLLYGVRCYHIAMTIVKNRVWAEEIVSLTFVKIMQYVRRHKKYIHNPSAWIHQIAKHTAYRFLRQERKLSGDDFSEETAVSVYEIDNIFLMDFYGFLEKLSDKYRDYAELRYVFGLTYKQIAEKVGKTENAVKLSFQHINTRLEEVMKKYFNK